MSLQSSIGVEISAIAQNDRNKILLKWEKIFSKFLSQKIQKIGFLGPKLQTMTKKYGRLSVQVWAQTAIYKSTNTIQIKMDALVNQSHAKKLFGARLVDQIMQKAIRS